MKAEVREQGLGIRERPILFSAPMVLGILAGRKTQTRRLVKKVMPAGTEFQGSILDRDCIMDRDYLPSGLKWMRSETDLCPHGKPGDRLWVREAMRITDVLRYDADQVAVQNIPAGWEDVARRPHATSMFMPRWASRITLEMTAVHVERLADISEEDAVAEGIVDHEQGTASPYTFNHQSPETLEAILASGKPVSFEETAREAYEKLWEIINGPGSWSANPWVWVETFKVIEGAA